MWKRFWRWLLNKDELDAIRKELFLLRTLIANEIERQTPKRAERLMPLGPVKNK